MSEYGTVDYLIDYLIGHWVSHNCQTDSHATLVIVYELQRRGYVDFAHDSCVLPEDTAAILHAINTHTLT